MPTWPDHAVWWHVYPLGFTGAERDALPEDAPVAHRLGHLEGWLDYLLELGANGLLLGPVFASETHGYDTVDHHRIDPRLGDEDDLRQLVAACRRAGIRVLLDGVFNHVGRGFGPFRDVLAHGRESRFADWFHLHGDGAGDELDYDHFEGHRHLVTLNHDHPEVEDHVVGVMEHWLDIGVDGWRLDAAYAVDRGFWRRVTDRVRTRFPDAWFLGEVIHAPYEPWIEDGGLDSVTQYELWKSIWSSLNDRNFHELAWTLQRHASVGRGLPAPDLRRQPRRHAHRDASGRRPAPRPRRGPPLHPAGDAQHLRRRRAGLHGREGGQPQRRRRRPTALPGRARRAAALRLGHLPHPPAPHRPRRRHPGIARGSLRVLDLDNDHLSYVVDGGGDRVVVMLNVSDHPRHFPQAAAALPGAVHAESSPPTDDPWHVAAHGWSVVSPTD